ncbi:YegS/Rv2252/BmrU family lipid kinase [Paenibacillus sp. JX-17]|uniref:YegS/Rv2252/BmrU family lipid kinase n=1 Tax=Paenibacillus lacisoli TaxID=3064525 RepID=A0ABT9CAJ1_9BACL|nr:YegS/Rv2252/BmrU family lipid kinase [Paenibacillus sp. JX-17]MDO7906274.1 YegS/Rv2252/BmrU family lipid kinase [Paenibacillus sp. JX-17]
MRQAMMISNPSSGREEAQRYVDQVRDVLASQGYEVILNETAGEGDATDFCRSACRDACDLVVSIGGDGTLHETINGMIDQDHRPRLGVVPLGTVNDFARALHIPLDPEQAIATLNSSRVHPVDLGRINEGLFANVAAAGSLAESLSAVSSEEKSKLGSLAYIKEGIKKLIHTPAYPLVIEHDGQVWEGEAPLFLAALTNSVGGFEKLVPGAEVDDGWIHCFVIKNIGVLNSLTLGTSLLFGSLMNHKDVVYFTARQVKVSSTESVSTNVDGEEGPPLPIHLSILPRYVEVVVPEEE